MRFPRLETRDLDGTVRVLPDDLPSGPRVIVMAFLRWHQLLVDGWIRAIEPARSEFPSLSVWEVPTLSRWYAPGRPYIDGGMRAGIPDTGVRQHTLTAYTDLKSLAKALDIPTTETVQVFLLDPTGEIAWRGAGQVEDEQLAELAERLAQLERS